MATYSAGILNAVVAAAALRAQTDKTIGFHKSISNIAITGPTGISQAITWDLEDPDTDAGYLNQNDITTLICHKGYRFWGNRTCSADSAYAFEVYTRTAHFILDTIINGCFPFVDQPLTPFLAKDIIDSIQHELTKVVNAKKLLGAKVWYDPNENSTEQLQQGQFWVDYDYTPVPPLEQLGLNQRITSRYLVDFGQLIKGTSSTSTGV